MKLECDKLLSNLKLKCDQLVSSFGFRFNLRHYVKEKVRRVCYGDRYSLGVNELVIMDTRHGGVADDFTVREFSKMEGNKPIILVIEYDMKADFHKYINQIVSTPALRRSADVSTTTFSFLSQSVRY